MTKSLHVFATGHFFQFYPAHAPLRVVHLAVLDSSGFLLVLAWQATKVALHPGRA